MPVEFLPGREILVKMKFASLAAKRDPPGMIMPTFENREDKYLMYERRSYNDIRFHKMHYYSNAVNGYVQEVKGLISHQIDPATTDRRFHGSFGPD